MKYFSLCYVPSIKRYLWQQPITIWILALLLILLSSCQQFLPVDPGLEAEIVKPDRENPNPNTPTELDEVIAAGMKAWRMPGDPNVTQGAACANCHAPDALDLAYFNFDDETIMRRALPHIAEADAQTIVEMVKAMRMKYNITDPKDPMKHRPLQPGGEVLPGDTPQERDLTFGQQLIEMGYRFATIPVLDEKEAMIQQREWLEEVDPRTLKIGLPFNRWSEDPHKGAEHASVADWLPDLGSLPLADKEDLWFELQDIYLQNPTDENFLAMYDAIDDYTHNPFEGNGKSLMAKKYKSVLVAQHMFRHEVTEGSLFGDRPTSAFFPLRMFGRKATRNGYNPIWDVGDFARVFEKDDDVVLPNEVMERIEASNREAMRRVKVPWFYAGWLFDQGLQRTSGSNSTKSAEYFSHFFQDDFSQGQPNKSGYSIHNIFMITRKKMVENFDSELAEKERINIGYSNFHGYGWDVKKAPRDSEERRAIYQFMVENSYRMMLYLVQADIKAKGKPDEKLREKWAGPIGRMENFFNNMPSDHSDFNKKLVADTRAMMN